VDREIIIEAAQDLSEKPIITYSGTVTDGSVLFEMQGLGELHLKGVQLDGGADYENLLYALIATSETPFSEYFRIKAENCDFSAVHNAGNGSFLKLYPGTRADSVVFIFCSFSDCDGIGLQMNSEEENSGAYNVSNLVVWNCTFWNIGKEAISVYSGDNLPFSIGPCISIDHCTFDNCGSSETPILHLREVDNVIVTNSIFSHSFLDTAAVILYGWAYIEYCDLFDCGPVKLERGAHQYNGMLELDPKYANASEGDFTLAYSSPVRGAGSDGKALGDLRWAGDVANSMDSDIISIVNDFQLYQNYPNPFNAETRIHFSLSRAENVEIQIYNMNGALVKKIENEYPRPGHYTLSWQPENTATGIYICRLTNGNQFKMIKMIYMK